MHLITKVSKAAQSYRALTKHVRDDARLLGEAISNMLGYFFNRFIDLFMELSHIGT